MIRDAIRLAVERKNLTTEMARAIMFEMMDGSSTPSQIASLITAMRMKGETLDELQGFVSAMRENAVKISAPSGAVDLCGTGGDGFNTFNISTVASFVVAATGVPVAKHGNRSVSSRSGSADLLSALGIPVDLEPNSVENCLRSSGLGFMFAPVFHRSMKNVLSPRREIGIRTLFNILGPMTNPAGVKHQLIGVYDFKLAPIMAKVLRNLGTRHAMIVNGNGMDEITNLGKTRVVELNEGEISEYTISPEMFGLEVAEPEKLKGGDPIENARITISILRGERSPRSDIVAMNAAAALYIAGKATSIEEGYVLANKVIINGKAREKLKEFSEFAREMEKERQEKQAIQLLRGRKILPEILRRRSGEISSDLFSQISAIDGSRQYLDVLDEELLRSPNILSVIVLNRVLRLLSDRIPELDSADHAPEKLSEVISSSKNLSVIAEYKPSSPSVPPLFVPPDPDYVKDIFTSCGVAGLSVLIEPDYFRGGPELFSIFRSQLSLPMLFKDFVVSEKQLELAARLGADAVLLIAKALKPEALESLVRSSIKRGIEPLVELHDERDLTKLKSCKCYDSVQLIGINSRDLRSLEIDLRRLLELRKQISEEKIFIAESGIRIPEDIRSLRGFDAVLIGSMFMQAEDLRKKTTEVVSISRSVAL